MFAILFATAVFSVSLLSIASSGSVCGRDLNHHLKALLIQEEAVTKSFMHLLQNSQLTR